MQHWALVSVGEYLGDSVAHDTMPQAGVTPHLLFVCGR